MKRTILVVDDEKQTRDFMARALEAKYRVLTAPDAEAALKTLRDDATVALMLSDVRMPGADGFQLLQAAKKTRPDLVVVLLTAFGTVEQAVTAVKEGAEDFIMKPVDLDQLEMRVAKAMEKSAMRSELEELHKRLDEKWGLSNITGSSEPMQLVFRTIRQVAPTDATVLVQGPSGTGKELVARAVHALSRRAKGPFVAVHCGAIPETLLESELFGHEKGAFTGATARQIGRFEAADGGTIFLDEISEISPATQVKLLRVLEDHTFQRLGGTETIRADFRVVAATNRDFRRYVDEGKFREDLFFRLSVVDVQLPPLKDRPGDVALLAARFVREFSAANGNRVTGVDPDALRLLERCSWPGNVRQLRNAVEKMVVLSAGGPLTAADVPADVRSDAERAMAAAGEPLAVSAPAPAMPPSAPAVSAPAPAALSGTLEDVEKARIRAALAEAKGNRTLAAKKLGISRRTIYRKIEEYGLDG
ncbi:MAG: sigma-54 dependent transcriptional regulator [Kiritimatiellae bacterium]|nr:sigma-54 dependent transcriptional regulator [Kiritimatiellia bacterium]